MKIRMCTSLKTLSITSFVLSCVNLLLMASILVSLSWYSDDLAAFVFVAIGLNVLVIGIFVYFWSNYIRDELFLDEKNLTFYIMLLFFELGAAVLTFFATDYYESYFISGIIYVAVFVMFIFMYVIAKSHNSERKAPSDAIKESNTPMQTIYQNFKAETAILYLNGEITIEQYQERKLRLQTLQELEGIDKK